MTVTYHDMELEVEFEYFPAFRNARGTHPHEMEQEYSAYVELESVEFHDTDLVDILSDESLDDIAEIVLRKIKDENDY